LCDGSSKRQIDAIGDALLDELKKDGSQRAIVEGTPESGWVLIDFGSVIVHIFSPEKRAYFQLEELWQAAPIVMRMI
jgi:ribosome-associated protein